jgi:hypothetical protein
LLVLENVALTTGQTVSVYLVGTSGNLAGLVTQDN